jgi:transcription termination/antitermination protein NusA
MAMEILDAFGQLTREKALDRSEVIELVKAGMLAAVRRKYGAEANADVTVDPTTGDIAITMLMDVVPTATEIEDPSRQMSIADAAKLPGDQPWGESEPEAGMVGEIPLDFRTFGRNAIQAAKQMIIQKVREEERERIRDEYADKVGQLVTSIAATRSCSSIGAPRRSCRPASRCGASTCGRASRCADSFSTSRRRARVPSSS